MATFTERPDLASALIRDIEAAYQDKRARKGSEPHVSDLLYCLRKAQYRRRGTPAPEREERDVLTLLVGHALHEVVAKSGVREGRDVNVPLAGLGIIGEADGEIAFWAGEEAIEEFKTTRQSTNKGPIPLTSPHYVEQVASYLVLRWQQTHKLWTRAIIYPLHLLGNYKPPFPKLLAWELNFEPEELMRWHQEMQRRVAVLESDTLAVGECAPADADKSVSWECGYCPYYRLKGGPCPGDPGRPAGFFVLDPVLRKAA